MLFVKAVRSFLAIDARCRRHPKFSIVLLILYLDEDHCIAGSLMFCFDVYPINMESEPTF